MFKDGFTDRQTFLTHINDNNSYWVNTTYIENHPVFTEKFPIHTYLSLDGNKRIVMSMPYDEIPKDIALGWLRQLGLRS